MTGESTTDVALQYVREELAAMRTGFTTLSAEIRTYIAEQGPRIAVLEHRVAEAERDVATIQTERAAERVERDRDRAEAVRETRRQRVQVYITLAACVVAAALSWLVKLIGG